MALPQRMIMMVEWVYAQEVLRVIQSNIQYMVVITRVWIIVQWLVLCLMVPLRAEYTSPLTAFGFGHGTCLAKGKLENVMWAQASNVFVPCGLLSCAPAIPSKECALVSWVVPEGQKMSTETKRKGSSQAQARLANSQACSLSRVTTADVQNWQPENRYLLL